MREAMQSTVADIYRLFYNMVAERRNMSDEKLQPLANGHVFTGNQAFKNGLIDAIGDENTALEWLKSIKKIDNSLKVRDLELAPVSSPWRRFFDSLMNVTVLLENMTKTGFFSFL